VRPHASLFDVGVLYLGSFLSSPVVFAPQYVG
jgi:hypothetical protein